MLKITTNGLIYWANKNSLCGEWYGNIANHRTSLPKITNQRLAAIARSINADKNMYKCIRIYKIADYSSPRMVEIEKIDGSIIVGWKYPDNLIHPIDQEMYLHLIQDHDKKQLKD